MEYTECGLIDLHLHLDGSLSLAVVKELAALQGIELAEDDEVLSGRLRVSADCRDLNEYLTKFDFPLSLLQTGEAIAWAVYRLQEELKELGLLYAEIRFAPQLHTGQGLSQEEVVRAAIDGLRRSDFRAGLILCCMRGQNKEAVNRETVELASTYQNQGVCAIDLAGAEALYPTAQFAGLFHLAKERGVAYTIHAGEADGPDSIRKALEYGTGRIGHGVRAVEDEALLKKLAAEGITLELCPTSNLNTCVFSGIQEYPLRRFLKAGVKVTINSDNMAVSGTDVRAELALVTEAFRLTEEERRMLLCNAAQASFADTETKEWLLGQITERAKNFNGI